jgi:hypothetical protein
MVVIWGRGFSKEQRELACLPIANGGLGIPWGFYIAWSAYVASRIQSAELQRSLASTVALHLEPLKRTLSDNPLLGSFTTEVWQKLLASTNSQKDLSKAIYFRQIKSFFIGQIQITSQITRIRFRRQGQDDLFLMTFLSKQYQQDTADLSRPTGDASRDTSSRARKSIKGAVILWSTYSAYAVSFLIFRPSY